MGAGRCRSAAEGKALVSFGIYLHRPSGGDVAARRKTLREALKRWF
jgi:hypothetical protein